LEATVQVPIDDSETIFPLTVQTDGVRDAKVTALPEEPPVAATE
jgi:hypothetical protein